MKIEELNHDHKTILCRCGTIIQDCYCSTSDKEFHYVATCQRCNGGKYAKDLRLTAQEAVSLFLQWVDKTKDIAPLPFRFYRSIPGLNVMIGTQSNIAELFVWIQDSGILAQDSNRNIIPGRNFDVNWKIYKPIYGEW